MSEIGDDATLPPPPPPGDVRVIGIVGTGVIGAGFAALYIAKGFTVKAYVRSEASRTKCEKFLEAAWHKLLKRELATEPEGWRAVVFCSTIAETVHDAHFVQESVLEAVRMKQRIVAEIDRHAPASTLIATSSSYLSRSLVALKCTEYPDRVVTGHPSLPAWDKFMEVLGSSREQTAWLASFYGAECGLVVVELCKESHGHVLNWLNFVLTQAVNMHVKGGFCSMEDMDKAMVQLGHLMVASGGVSTAWVGMVGGGSSEAFYELATDITHGMPLAVGTCMVNRWFGNGLFARALTSTMQAVYMSLFGWAWVRRLLRSLVSMSTAGMARAFDEKAAAAGSKEILMETVLDRMCVLEKKLPPLPERKRG